MNRQNIIITIIVMLVIALAVFLWINNSKETIAPEISNDTSNTNTEQSNQPSDSSNAEFEESLGVGGTNWVLSRVTVDQKAIDMNMNVPAPLTLRFDFGKNSYSGFAGCNNFSGTYSAANSYAFDFGAKVSTKMACEATMELENAIFEAMDETVSYGIKGNKLVFESKDGYTQLLYNPAK